MMRKAICFFLSLFTAVNLCACGGNDITDEARITVVTAVFAAYDWCREIIGENPGGLKLVYLPQNGADLHSFQPSFQDVITIAEADVFVYNGGESDAWCIDALAQAENEDITPVSLMDILSSSLKEEEITEGMTHKEESGEEEEYDEHVWLSVKNAKEAVLAIKDVLCAKDPDHRETYETNTKTYLAKLDQLDEEYQKTVNSAEPDTLLFADRFPFLYLVREYGLKYYAAFPGCSAESEASFETVLFLAAKADELGVNTFLLIEGSGERLAETIKDNTEHKDQKILHLDSMQGVSMKRIEAGAAWLSLMYENLEILKQALNVRE